jgi:beta-glucosidase
MTCDIAVQVRNAGKLAGRAVTQVYLDAPADPIAGVSFAPRTLAGFESVELQPGEERKMDIEIAPRAFQYWSEAEHIWKNAPGLRMLRLGFSSRDLPLAVTLP